MVPIDFDILRFNTYSLPVTREIKICKTLNIFTTIWLKEDDTAIKYFVVTTTLSKYNYVHRVNKGSDIVLYGIK